MAVNDLYLIVDKQLIFDQLCLNMFWYKQTGGTHTSALDVGEAWLAHYMSAAIALQSSALVHIGYEVTNITNLTDFAEAVYATPPVGTITGQALPPYAAWGFKILRSTRAVRNGAKRIAGVAESSQSNGVIVDGLLTTAQDLADAIAGELSTGLGDTLLPQIVHKSLVDGAVIYEPTRAAGCVYERITTQNTRKFGRGT